MSSYSSTLFDDTAKIMSKNGLKVNIIVDENAVFTVKLAIPEFKITTEGMMEINGSSPYDGNVYDGMVVSQDSPRTLAHELLHKAGQPHFWETVDQPKTTENEKISNTRENKDNLMNSDGNPDPLNASVTGTDIKPSQTKGVINHIKIYNENRERNEKKKSNENNP